MNKADVLQEIEDLKNEIRKENEKPVVDNIRQHNLGGIYWLNELKFRIEKKGRQQK